MENDFGLTGSYASDYSTTDKIDDTLCDFQSMRNSNHIDVHLVYGRYRRFDVQTGGRYECLKMYAYNKETQIPEKVVPLTIEMDNKTMWLVEYTYKSRAQAMLDGDLKKGVHMYGQFWSEVTQGMHQRGYIR